LANRLPKSSQRRLAVITGARQTGKTTLCRQIYPELRYVNLDAAENRDFVRTLRAMSWGKNLGPAVLDEAQKEPGIFDKVKYSFDEGEIDFTVLLGSSQILLLKRIRETLAGRAFFNGCNLTGILTLSGIWAIWRASMISVLSANFSGWRRCAADRFWLTRNSRATPALRFRPAGVIWSI
jgi:hypothetical protein